MDSSNVALAPQLAALCRTARALFAVAGTTVHLDGGPANDADDADAARVCLSLIGTWCQKVGDGGIVVEDAAADPRFAATLAAADLPLRFLAGAPIASPDGPSGWFCLFDSSPRPFSPEERRRLADLAALAAQIVACEARAVAAMRQADFFRLLADHSTDTLVRGNLDGVRLYISPAVRTLLGYETEEMIGRQAREIIHPDDAEAFGMMMADVRAGRVELATSEHRQRHKDGHWVWLEAHIRLTRDSATGAADGYVVSVRDVSRRKEAEARLEHIASHDPLTGLANRTLFRERLAQEIARSRRTGAHFALFWIDLDRFKDVNDRLGHEAGDVVLTTVAQRLKAAVRTEDTVARIGGDEFVVLRAADGSAGGATDAGDLAARLVGTMDQPVDYAGVPVRVGLSVGVALTQTEGFDADRLLRVADEALYRAKNGGRGRYVVGG